MAIKATVCKANIQVSDMDRGYYNELVLTIAQHPSENDERMMVRLLAFILHASESLTFTEGVSAKEDEPDIWQKSLAGDVEVWIEIGLPDEKKIKKACNRAKQIFVYSYGGRPVNRWWQQIAEKLSKHNNLTVINLPEDSSKLLAKLAQRAITLQCTIQDGQVWIGDSSNNITIEPKILFSGAEN